MMSGVEHGYYNDLGAPLLNLRLHGKGSREIEITVLIDTGVNCSLLLFDDCVRIANWPVTNRFESVFLADGSERIGYWTGGYIRWLGQTTYVDTLVIDRPKRARRQPEAGFIGMGLLRGHQIRLNPSEIEIIKS